jgi:hypothetical protein
VTTRTHARANRKRHRRGYPRQTARPPALLDESGEIELDRRSELWLIPQSLLAILVVVTLVVVGRLLAPGGRSIRGCSSGWGRRTSSARSDGTIKVVFKPSSS